MKKSSTEHPPTWEDRLRVLSYVVFVAWPLTFFFFTPHSFGNALEVVTLVIWMVPTVLGAIMAALGAALRIDFKLELPGLILMLVGPGFYAFSQLFFSLFPPEGSTDVRGRYHLVAMALYFTIVHLPRIAKLQKERRQTRRVHLQQENLVDLTDEQKAQPGAFHSRGGEK